LQTLKGIHTGIAIGNVIGSNIANILLILGVSSLVYPIKVTKGTVRKEIPFSLLSVIALGVMVNKHIFNNEGQNILVRSDGILLLLFFIIFIYYTFSIATKVDNVSNGVAVISHSLFRSCFMVIIGLVSLIFGAKWIVDGAVQLAASMGMSQSLIGLTIVAVGT
jgi:cation:H+ antiporter